MLWPGFYMSSLRDYPEPILNEIPKIRLSLEGQTQGMYNANCTTQVEELQPGVEFFWFFPKDEIHHVLKGEADITYSLAGTSHTEKKNAHLSQGDWYVVPAGARVTWKVTSTMPFRYLWLTMPGIPKSKYKRTDAVKL
ncbi:MAG: cupin domain-containing protein [Chloroflexota bacterium]